MRSEPTAIDGTTASPFGYGGMMLFLLLVVFWLSGGLFPLHGNSLGMSPAQIAGMSLTYSVTPAFLIAGLLHLQKQTRTSLDQLVDSGRILRETAKTRGSGGLGIGLVTNSAATLVGLFLGAAQVRWQPLMESAAAPDFAMVLGLAIGNLLTWIVIAHVILRRVLAAIDLHRLGRRHTEVDLLRLDTLLPFGRIATLHLLMVVVAVSLSALQALDAEVRWINYGAALAAGIPAGLVLTLVPMMGVRRSVRVLKRRMLEKLDDAIRIADRSLEPDSLRILGDLLKRREVIEHAREWPLDTTAFSKIAIYFVIPPIAWVGGALVEVFIQSAL